MLKSLLHRWGMLTGYLSSLFYTDPNQCNKGRIERKRRGGKEELNLKLLMRQNYILENLIESINNLLEFIGMFKWLLYLVTLPRIQK